MNKTVTGKRIKKSKMSMRAKLFAYLALFVVFALTLMWLFQFVFLKDFYEAIMLHELKRDADVIADNLDSPEVKHLAERIAQDGNLCVLVFSIEGRKAHKTVSVDMSKDCMIHRISGEDLARLYSEASAAGGTHIEHIRRDAFRNLFYDVTDFKGDVPDIDSGMPESTVYVKIVNEGEKEHVIMLNTAISPVGATIDTLFIQICLISVILTVFAGVLALFISRRISKPISKINDSAKMLANGNYDVHFDGTGFCEIDELNDTLNYAVSELSKTDKLQKELISNISHDLRTPLTLISGYAEVMRDIPSENTPENLQIIIDETSRLTALVNDLLDLSKIKAGTQQMNFERFNITELVREVMERYTKLVEKDGYAIDFESSEEVYVTADRTRMLQVIYNYVNNAINYTGDNKKVVISQTVSGGNVRISVTDSGEGIAEEELPYIWDRYYKSSKAHKRASVGSGIGLSIVKEILVLHGARFGVESSLGKGSTFWFEMKISE